jgi:rhodanese-related sulfurtransferase
VAGVDHRTAAGSDADAMNYRDLDPTAAQQELQRDKTMRILDVRTEPEYTSHRLPGAVLIPVQELDRRWSELDKDANWLVHCEHGRRSLFACEMLAQAGFKKLANLRGGLAHWAGSGLPLEQGKKA